MQPSFWITVLLSIVLARSLPLSEVEASPAGKSPNWITNTAGQDPSSRRQLAGLPIPLLAGSPSPPVNSTSPPTPSSSSAPSSTSTSTPSSSESQTSPKPNILKRANKPLPQQVASPHTTLSRRQIENIKLAMTRAPRSPAPSARAIKEPRKVELKAPVAPPTAPTNAVPPHPARGVAAIPSLPVTPPGPPTPSPRDVAPAPALPVAPTLPIIAPSPPSPSPRDVPAASSESVKMSAAPHAALVGRQLRAPDYNSAGPQADDSASGSEDAKAHAEEEATPANKKHDTHDAQDQAKERRYGGSPEWIADSDLGETSDESKRSLSANVPISGKKHVEEAHKDPSEHSSATVQRIAARLVVGSMEQMARVY